MPEIIIIYWRDIPAQVLVGKGRRGIKRQLTNRFEQAIDMAAMRAGLAGNDGYLAEWHKDPLYTLEGDAEALADQEALRLEKAYDKARLMKLIENRGREVS